MGSRSTSLRRIEQLESAVVAFGRGVAAGVPGPRAALHVLPIAEAARAVVPAVRVRPPAPVG